MNNHFASCLIDGEKGENTFFPEVGCLISVSVVSCIKSLDINIKKSIIESISNLDHGELASSC